MATTRNFTVNATAWTLIASGTGQTIKVEGDGSFVLCITVGSPSVRPEIPVGQGHRFRLTAEIPLVAKQQLWASASTTRQITVT